MNLEIIKKIENKGDYLSISFECGLNFNTTSMYYEKEFKVGETVDFQSGRNRYASYIYKISQKEN